MGKTINNDISANVKSALDIVTKVYLNSIKIVQFAPQVTIKY
jgi:hypothetical protein